MTNLKNIALVVLLLMNIGLVLMLWLRPMPHQNPKKGMAPPPRKAEGFLVRALDLDEQQRVELKKLRDDHFKETRGIHEEARKSKRAMFDALVSSTPDTLLAQRYADEYANQMKKIDEALIQHYLDIRVICRPEQQEELRKVFRKAIRRPPAR